MSEGRPGERWLKAISTPKPTGEEAPHHEDHAAPEADDEHPARRRGIYLLPNLITTAALFCGFYAIVAAMNGRYGAASIAVFAAMVLDAADGRVARLTRTQSAFGAEYDSLSDMVAFGVAPALVAFSWAVSMLGQVGWVATFVYMACAALRLARYNTQGTLTSFTGLASPAAAAVVASTVWMLDEYRVAGEPVDSVVAGVLAALLAVLGLLMVSHFTYFSPKMLNIKGRVPFVTLVAVALGFAIVFADPPRVLLGLFGLYALSGPVQHFWERMHREGD
jgi:CDP-diacylglycerol--serine O-phosphatidyltransferase